TRHARAPEAAVAVGILREVLLVVLLGVVELRRRHDLGHDRAVACVGELDLKPVARGVRGATLVFPEIVDAGTVLRPDIVALPHALCGIVILPEYLQQLFVGDDFRIEYNEDDFGVAGHPRAHFFVRRVWRRAGGVPDGRRVDAAERPELPL